MRIMALVLTAGLSLATVATAQEDLASPDSVLPGLPWFSHVVGSCWSSELSQGETYDRQCFGLQFDKVVRVEQAIDTWKDGRVVSTLNANSVYAWDPRTEKIRHVFWGSDGSYESATGWIEGDALILYLDREIDAEGNVPARTVLRKAGDSTYCALREKRQGSLWVKLFSFVYERDGAAGAAISTRTNAPHDQAVPDCE